MEVPIPCVVHPQRRRPEKKSTPIADSALLTAAGRGRRLEDLREDLPHQDRAQAHADVVNADLPAFMKS